MQKIPMEWIDKLFDCMAQFYGERWARNFTAPNAEKFAKAMWQSALHGSTYDQIKAGLVLVKRGAQEPGSLPPHPLEFFRYSKGESEPAITYYKPSNQQRGSVEVATEHLSDIRHKLSGHFVPCETRNNEETVNATTN